MKARRRKFEYKASSTARFGDEEAQRVGEALEELGPSDAAGVVEAARDGSSVLHRHFEWDDARAAHRYRIDQARRLVRSIETIRQGADRVRRRVRAFHSVVLSGADDRTYVSFPEVASSIPLQEQVANEARAELLVWRDRYAALEAVFPKAFARVVQAEEALDAEAV